MKDPKYVKAPSMEQIHKPMARATGGYELVTLADHFTFLVDPQGYAVVAFDTTMEPLSYGDMFFGSIGIGNWSIRNIWKRYKATREKPSELLADGDARATQDEDAAFQQDYDALEKAEADAHLPAVSADDVKRGYEAFAKMEFNDRWIAEHQGATILASGKKSGFMPASFSLADLRYSDKQTKKLYPSMAEFSRVIYGEKLEQADLNDFLKQFKFDWNQEKQEFNVMLSPASTIRLSAKRPQIPGWVLNYASPYDILQYKYSLVNLDRMAAGLDMILGRYASVLMIMVSRVTDGLRSQMDSHENQLIALFDAAMHDQYDTGGIPKNFMDASLDLLYLNKVTNTDDITNGPAKRAEVLAEEAKNHDANLKWFDKHHYTVSEWADGRTATVFDKNGKRKGIASLAIKGMPLVKTPSFHVYDGAKWFKEANRVALELFVDAIRFVLPQQIALPIASGIGIDFYVPGEIWNILFRTRSYTEIAYEGHLIAAINEKIAGRWGKIPGYDDGELADLRGALYSQRVNPYEVPQKSEANAIARNYQRIKDFLTGAGGAVTAPKYVVLDEATAPVTP